MRKIQTGKNPEVCTERNFHKKQQICPPSITQLIRVMLCNAMICHLLLDFPIDSCVE